ncbi:MAG: DUF2306 domain-containing protein [Streptosporangiales bacterium]|nr:DUF2306 domain-containing protein [Streptosporangiales bacterium]
MQPSRIEPRSEFHLAVLAAHVFTASVATLTGPLQFWPWLRSRYPTVHRWSGERDHHPAADTATHAGRGAADGHDVRGRRRGGAAARRGER